MVYYEIYILDTRTCGIVEHGTVAIVWMGWMGLAEIA